MAPDVSRDAGQLPHWPGAWIDWCGRLRVCVPFLGKYSKQVYRMAGKVVPWYVESPSFVALALSGILLLVIIGYMVVYVRQLTQLSHYHSLTLLSFLSLAVGVHGLLHLGAESVYGFNPYLWMWTRKQ